MDPAWVAIIVGVVSSIITALITGSIAYAALRAWMARREERETAMRKEIDYNEDWRHLTATPRLNDHETRLRVLENEIDLRPPPMDYAR